MSNRTFLGKVGMTPRGEWNNTTTYERLDVVSYEGSSYIALTQSRNSRPSEENQDWMIGAKHGEFTEEQLEEFKEAVIAESKQEIEEFTETQKDELDAYETVKESELDDYTTGKKGEIDTHTTQKLEAYNANANTKQGAFNSNATNKTNAFNENVTSKTTDFNDNASAKTTAFNNNSVSKTEDFDTNASNKTTSYNDNATSKTNAFNQNALDKKSDFNLNASDKQSDFDTNATNKTGAYNDNATSKTEAFNENYTEKLNAFNQAAASIQAGIDNIEEVLGIDIDTYSSSSTYDLNDLVVYDNKIYRCITAITVAEEWDSTKWIEVDILTLIKEIQVEQEHQDDSIGALQEENERLRNDINAGTLTVPGTGENVTLENTTDARFKKLGVGGNVKQTQYEGKNLFNATDYSNIAFNTNSSPSDVVKNTDNIKFTANGNYSGLYITNSNVSNYIDNLDSETIYTVSVDVEVDVATSFQIGSSTTPSVSLSAGKQRISVETTIPSALIFYNRSSSTVNYTISKIMISTVSDTTYEPYCGGQPSPNPNYPQEIKSVKTNSNIVVCNKNFLDIEKNAQLVTHGLTFNTDENGVLTINGTSDTNVYLKLYSNTLENSNFDRKKKIKAGTYTMSTKVLTSLSDINVPLYIRNQIAGGTTFCNIGKIFNATEKSKTFTLTEDTECVIYMWIANGTTLDNAKIQIQLEQGSTATEYTANEQQEFIMPVQREMLTGDYFDWDNEKEIHNWNKIASYDGETITTEYISTTGGLDIGATVYYKRETPEKLNFTEQQITVAKQIRDTAHSYSEQTHIYSTDDVSPNFDIQAVGDINKVIQSLDSRLTLVE